MVKAMGCELKVGTDEGLSAVRSACLLMANVMHNDMVAQGLCVCCVGVGVFVGVRVCARLLPLVIAARRVCLGIRLCFCINALGHVDDINTKPRTPRNIFQTSNTHSHKAQTHTHTHTHKHAHTHTHTNTHPPTRTHTHQLKARAAPLRLCWDRTRGRTTCTRTPTSWRQGGCTPSSGLCVCV